MTEFFQTMMGKQFFDATMPRIARSIEALNETVKGLNARLDINQKHDKEFIEQSAEARVENQKAIELLEELISLKEQMGKIIELHTSPTVTVEGQPKLYDEDGVVVPKADRVNLQVDWPFPPPLEHGHALRTDENATRAMAGTHVESPVLSRIQGILWPGGDEEHEWDSDTFCELAEALHDAGFGPGKMEEPKKLWDDDLVQFARLLCEVSATQEIDSRALQDSMGLDPCCLNELFDRAHDVWERSKKDNCPTPCCERDHDGDGDCDKHPSLLEQLRARYGMEDLDEHIHEVKAEEAKSINNSSFEEQVSYLRRQCGDAWVKDALLDGPPPPKDETVQEEADREADCEP